MILSFVIMFILHLLTPYWWWIIVIPFLYGVIRSSTGRQAFFAGMSSAGLLWGIAAIYFGINGGESIVLRIGQMLGSTSPFLLLIGITTLTGMLGGASACLSGFYLKVGFYKEEKK